MFSEKQSGLDKERPELARCLEYVREGDVLVVTKLDRLARSAGHLHHIVETLDRKGVGFKVLHQRHRLREPLRSGMAFLVTKTHGGSDFEPRPRQLTRLVKLHLSVRFLPLLDGIIKTVPPIAAQHG